MLFLSRYEAGYTSELSERAGARFTAAAGAWGEKPDTGNQTAYQGVSSEPAASTPSGRTGSHTYYTLQFSSCLWKPIV